MKKSIKIEYDSPWKNTLNSFLQAFMELCFPNIAIEIDWSKGYESLDKELQAMSRKQVVGKRIADNLFKIWLKTGTEIWLLLHIEVQASKETNFPERMYIYNYRIFDRYRKPTLTLAILADTNPNWRPNQYHISPFSFSQSNFLNFGFSIVKLLDYASQENELVRQKNPFAIVIWAHLEALKTKKEPKNRLKSKMKITRTFYSYGFNKEYILNLFSFIDWVLALPEPLELEYIQHIEQLEEKNNMHYITSIERMGIQKGERIGIQKGERIGIQKGERIGIEKGLQQGERILLLRLLEKRFGILSTDCKKRLDKANEHKLLHWAERVLDAEKLEDIFDEK